MSSKLKPFIILFIIIALITVGLLLWNAYKKKLDLVIVPPESNIPTKNTNNPSNTGGSNLPVGGNPNPNTEKPISDENTPEKEEAFLLKMATSFAERFGSYSNQAHYENLVDLSYFMTENMKSWVNKKVASIDPEKEIGLYYGVTTRAINANIKTKAVDSIEVIVKTQQQEFYGANNNNKVIYKDILIKFKKEGSAWKVDGAYWQ